MEFFSDLLSALPGAAAQGLIWGLMAIGVFITFRVLDLADLTVDGTMATGGAVCIVMMLSLIHIWYWRSLARSPCSLVLHSRISPTLLSILMLWIP